MSYLFQEHLTDDFQGYIYIIVNRHTYILPNLTEA